MNTRLEGIWPAQPRITNDFGFHICSGSWVEREEYKSNLVSFINRSLKKINEDYNTNFTLNKEVEKIYNEL
ncbi:MAG: hypothetical protein HUJ68_12155 [Clostridia bacterium]|nr:hypothetical protein [Clostridia bacterium]